MPGTSGAKNALHVSRRAWRAKWQSLILPLEFRVRPLGFHTWGSLFFLHFRMQYRFESVRVGTEFCQHLRFSEPEYLVLAVHFCVLTAECFHCAIILGDVHCALQLPILW